MGQQGVPAERRDVQVRAETQAGPGSGPASTAYDEIGLEVGRKIGDLVVTRAKIDGADS